MQANTFCVDVWNSHEKTNNLKFKKAGFSAKSQRFPRFCTPNPQIWAENRRFAALAKRNHQKAKIGLLMIIIENGIYSKWPSRVKLPPSCPGSMVLPGPVSAVCALMSFCPSCMQGLTCPLPSPVLHLTRIFFPDTLFISVLIRLPWVARSRCLISPTSHTVGVCFFFFFFFFLWF